MKQVRLGATNQKVSAVALGIMRMVRLDTDQAANILNTVHDQGVNFIDGADIYGNGESEKIFGQPLRSPAWSGMTSLFNQRVGSF